MLWQGPEQAGDRLTRGLQDPGEGSLPRQGEEEEEEEKEAEESDNGAGAGLLPANLDDQAWSSALALHPGSCPLNSQQALACPQ